MLCKFVGSTSLWSAYDGSSCLLRLVERRENGVNIFRIAAVPAAALPYRAECRRVWIEAHSCDVLLLAPLILLVRRNWQSSSPSASRPSLDHDIEREKGSTWRT